MGPKAMLHALRLERDAIKNDPATKALYERVTRVVARVKELEPILFKKSDDVSYEDHLAAHKKEADEYLFLMGQNALDDVLEAPAPKATAAQQANLIDNWKQWDKAHTKKPWQFWK